MKHPFIWIIIGCALLWAILMVKLVFHRKADKSQKIDGLVSGKSFWRVK